MTPEPGSVIFQKAISIAGIIAINVAIYLFDKILSFVALPNSFKINLCIRVAVSKVVAANEITKTAINVFANGSDNPIDVSKAPPPSTNALALFPLACAQVS